MSDMPIVTIPYALRSFGVLLGWKPGTSVPFIVSVTYVQPEGEGVSLMESGPCINDDKNKKDPEMWALVVSRGCLYTQVDS